MSSVTVLAKTLGGTLLKNAPGIMAGVGAAGLIATAIFAGQASIRADELIREDEAMLTVEDTREPMTVLKDRIKLVWKLYIPTIAMGALSIACIFGSHHVNVRRAAALLGAASAPGGSCSPPSVGGSCKVPDSVEGGSCNPLLLELLSLKPMG